MDLGGASSVASTSSDRPGLEPKHKVFLSHSGAQKGFVEQLCIDLQRSDRYPFFDRCRDSLPIGKKFPGLIFEAIRQCEVGVVVVSEEYFTRSKWPMQELNAMVKAQKENGNMTIVPVFVGISREQCRDECRIEQWVSRWHGWAEDDKRVDVEEWKQALRVFGPTNDLSCVGGALGEVQCREEIVQAICKLVPPNTAMDDSYVQGRSRLCKVIKEKINEVQESAWYGVRVVGVYGVGGIGKTTACKTLCNEYREEFHGKVCHAELGNENEGALVQDMLRRLTDTRHEVVRDFNTDECRDRLKRDIHKQRVFLAVDNVSDALTIMAQAKCYLTMGYREGSIIVVTARSLDILQALKIRECDCLEMPELEEAEARCLFVHHASLPPDESNKRNVVQHVERCRFKKGNGSSYQYHPLALKVLGLQVGFGLENGMESEEVDVFNKLRNGDKHPVFSILRQSFDALLEEDQLLFMDAALFSPRFEVGSWNGHGDYIFRWLSMVHGISVDILKKRLLGLKRKSLIEEVGDGSTGISIHDLWREFAVMETTRGEEKQRRWVYMEYDAEEMRAGDALGVWCGCENVRRVCLSAKSCFLGVEYRMKEVKLGNCSNITVLKLLRLDLANVTVDLSGLKHLKSLEFRFKYFSESLRESMFANTGVNSDPGVEVLGLGKVINLVEIVWTNVNTYSSPFEDIGCLTNLQVLKLNYVTNVQALKLNCMRKNDKFLKLERLCSLRELCLGSIGLDNLSGLSSRMTNLQYVVVDDCWNLSSFHGVGDLVALKVLIIRTCDRLEELPNLQELKSLQEFQLSRCHRITSIPGLEGLVSLQKLRVYGCTRLTGLLDLSNLTNLQHLDIGSYQRVKSYKALEGPVSGVGYLVNLQFLEFCQEWLEDYGDLKKLAKLQNVTISRCDPAGFQCIGMLANLETLKIRDCKGVDDLASIRFLTRLQELELEDSDLKDVSDLRHLTALQYLRIWRCHQLERLPDMQELVWLEDISIVCCRKLRVWGSLKIFGSDVHTDWFLPQLEVLDLIRVPLTEFPDLSHFPRLRRLGLSCEDLTSLRSCGQLTTLEEVDLSGCYSLRDLPDFNHSRRLIYFELEGCVAKLNSHVIENLEAMCPLLELKIVDTRAKRKLKVEKEEVLMPGQNDPKMLKVV